jgi:hypothetical protein
MPTGEHPWHVAVDALIQLDVVERSCLLGEHALKAQLNELHRAMDRDREAFENPHDEGDYFAHVNDEYWQVERTLPRLHWYAQFLIAYSYFERALNQLCRAYQSAQNQVIGVTDLAGQGISRARDYLVKVAKITGPFDASEWQTAKLMADIRNAIAHRLGDIEHQANDPGSLYMRLKKVGIQLSDESTLANEAALILTKERVIDAIQVYRRVIEAVGGLERNFVTPKHGLPSGPYASVVPPPQDVPLPDKNG